MDAATRAELDALRRRAFGPNADIHDDEAALARLIELEDLARALPTSDAMYAPADPPEPPEPEPALPDTPPPALRAHRGTLLVGAAAAVAITIAVLLAQPPADPVPVSAPTPTPTVEKPRFVFTADPHSEQLFSIPRDGAFGGYVELTSDTPAPAFPATTPLAWTAALGEYYGWELWIAGGNGEDDDEHCILIRRADDTRARCVDADGQRLGTLRVSLAGADIPAEELTEPMSDDQRIRFWWLDTGRIEVILGSFGRD